jgi:hypothetical protein
MVASVEPMKIASMIAPVSTTTRRGDNWSARLAAAGWPGA